jgi:hypothetical protein
MTCSNNFIKQARSPVPTVVLAPLSVVLVVIHPAIWNSEPPIRRVFSTILIIALVALVLVAIWAFNRAAQRLADAVVERRIQQARDEAIAEMDAVTEAQWDALVHRLYRDTDTAAWSSPGRNHLISDRATALASRCSSVDHRDNRGSSPNGFNLISISRPTTALRLANGIASHAGLIASRPIDAASSKSARGPGPFVAFARSSAAVISGVRFASIAANDAAEIPSGGSLPTRLRASTSSARRRAASSRAA